MINRIIPLLLTLVNSQAGRIKEAQFPLTEKGKQDRFLAEMASLREKEGLILKQGKPGQPDHIPLEQKMPFPGPHQAPSLLPLPLKTPLFSAADFYLVQDQDKNKAAGKEDKQKIRINLLLILRTAHLGVLRLFLRQEEKILWLACLGHEAAVKNLLAGELARLEEEILALGYEKVFFNFKHLSPDKNINIPTGPDFPGTEFIFDLYV
ncbi:MAG TPA: hypothetical protein DHV84_05225 [Desulfotomaculum sp.]|nr:hypothetical protein [Desulfotomaculum sp.]